MKLTKSLFLAFAGLGLFACSNEEVVDNGGIDGGATVTVKIADVISRAPATPTMGDNNDEFPVDIQSAKLILEAAAGGDELDITQELKESNSQFTFSQVRNPTKLTLVINDGQESGLVLEDVVNTGLAEPLYASTTQFTPTSETEYTATLQPEHRLARLQFSGLDFKTAGSSYTALRLDGIYLNGAIKVEGTTGDKLIANASGAWTTVKDWSAPVFDEINKIVIGAGAEDGPWPSAGCYAYNILPNGNDLPKLTVCFSGAEQPNVVGAGTYRYARVATYKVEGNDFSGLAGVEENGTITEFVPGYIYNITKLEMADKDLGPTPEGGKDITLTATVTVTPWKLINGTVEWQ
ncbi:hypothetical protein [uncultured Bacteroides sp.]|uniref:hypothetical protein n=1 Tax=uncultured Bacteroides sp. TaxID=162156 RepID=UPI00280A78C4|nr:hypothetical protein [uncultured Bacteroides sp.]